MTDITGTPINIDETPIVLDTPESTGDEVEELDTPVIKKVTTDNKFLIKKELEERKILEESDDFKYLYPNLNDPNFNIKIAEKQEFYDTRYDGAIKNVEEYAEKMCNAQFELAPHQAFVRNFMSFQTPYNGLLLYHGLGSGKTCSAISVAEEMRDYLKQMGITKRILVVASPNVQDNFKLQLFDERKLKEIDGLWNLRACTGNKFLKEINPMNMKGLTKEKVIGQVKRIINASYLFIGYIELSNLIEKKGQIDGDYSKEQKERLMKRRLERFFEGRLIIIDEIHNIRVSEENKNKRVAVSLLKLVKSVSNLRLLLLSATPMYNNYREIIWLINLLNINDGRSTVSISDIFDKGGNLLIDSEGREVGKETLMRKVTGYVSFIRGDNPYTFPYRIFPELFAPERTFSQRDYPAIQLNGKEIIEPLQYINVYLNGIGEYQNKSYDLILELLKDGATKGGTELPNFSNMETFGYAMLQSLLEALNIVYPDEQLDDEDDLKSYEKGRLIGKQGLRRIMNYQDTKSNPPVKGNFEYKSDVLSKYGEIFSPDILPTYSAKMSNICSIVTKSEGIVLIYSQYIDGGLVPMALALESIGITKYGSSSLFKVPPTEPIDAITGKPKSEVGEAFSPAKYIMITGDKAYSPNNDQLVKAATSENNLNGEKVKVILISKAGSEGLDFANIRQVHILEPWYNMNRVEQIVGRAVRNKSHCRLPFSKRNVEIYFHSTILPEARVEAADLYLYRLSEVKAIQIGHVSRVLKQSAIDCLLNQEQNNFTVEKMDQSVKQILSTGQTIDYQVGDKPFTAICDYMDQCSFECKPTKLINQSDVAMDTYDSIFIQMNTEKINQRIRQLFIDSYFYKKKDLIARINAIKEYPIVQIDAALTQLITDRNEIIMDKYRRPGRLVNVGNYYLFQPIELSDTFASIYDRSTPLQYKRDSVLIDLPESVKETNVKEIKLKKKTTDEGSKVEKIVMVSHNAAKSIIEEMYQDYLLATTEQVIARGEINWYKFCGLTIEKLMKLGIDEDLLISFLVAHLIEMLVFDSKINILNYLYQSGELNDFERLLKAYFDAKLMSSSKMKGIILANDTTQQLMIWRDSSWVKAEPMDYMDFKDEILKYVVLPANLSVIVGFIIIFKKQYMIFKVKDMTLKRHKGARCDQAGKKETLKILNKIVGKEEYTIDNTRDTMQIELCSLQEFLLRYFDYTKKDNKRWYLSPEEAVINNIENIRI